MLRAYGAGGWGRTQRRLHWWTAILVLTAFPLGWVMVGVPIQELLLKFVLYQLHKTIGLTVLALTIARLAVRRARGRPEWDDLPAGQRRAAGAMHAVLFALLVLVPLLGYLTAATAPAQVPTLFLGVIPVPHVVGVDAAWFGILRQVHRACATVLVALALGHAAAAVHNHLRGRATLVRMWRG